MDTVGLTGWTCWLVRYKGWEWKPKNPGIGPEFSVAMERIKVGSQEIFDTLEFAAGIAIGWNLNQMEKENQNDWGSWIVVFPENNQPREGVEVRLFTHPGING